MGGPVLVPALASAVTASSFTSALTAACEHGALAGKDYASMLITDGFDNPEALAAVELEDLMSAGISRGHAKSLLRRFFEPVVGLSMSPHEGGRGEPLLMIRYNDASMFAADQSLTQSLTTPEHLRCSTSEPETGDENRKSVELEETLELEFEREMFQLLSPASLSLASPGLCAESDETAANATKNTSDETAANATKNTSDETAANATKNTSDETAANAAEITSDATAATIAGTAGASAGEAPREIGTNQAPATPILPCEIPPTRFMPSSRLTWGHIDAAVGALEAEGFTVVVDLTNREDRAELTAVYHDRLYNPPSKDEVQSNLSPHGTGTAD